MAHLHKQMQRNQNSSQTISKQSKAGQPRCALHGLSTPAACLCVVPRQLLSLLVALLAPGRRTHTGEEAQQAL